VSLECIEKILANNVENPGERQLCAINPNLSWQRKQKKNMENYFEMVQDGNNCVSFGHSKFSNFLSTIQTKDDTHYKLQKK